MSAVAELDTAPQTIETNINYILNDGTKLFTYSGGPGSTEVKTQATTDPHRVTMHNARPHLGQFKLEVDGFRFVDHPTRMKDFFDPDEIKRVYYPEMVELVKAESGANRVVVFDHTLRTADKADQEERKIREAVHRAHNDYTEWSGPQRLRDLLPDEADELLKRRFAIIQVWRPIRHPVETDPLAICDARSVSASSGRMSRTRCGADHSV